MISTQVRVELRYHPCYSGPYGTARRHFKDEFAAVVVHRTRKRVIPLGASVEKWSSWSGGGGGGGGGWLIDRTIAKGLEGLGVKPLKAMCLKGVPRLGAMAADAILKVVESCTDHVAKVAAVATVKQVFRAQGVSLDRILLDGEDERGLDEVLEKCREVLREVQQAAHGGDTTKARAARAAQHKALVKGLEDLDVKKPLYAMSLKGVSWLRAVAADAILKLVEPCASNEAKKVAAVAAVERVFKAQHKSLYKILFDGDDTPRGLDEVLEACREVLRQVEQAKSERPNDGGLTKDEKRRIVVLEEKFRSMWGKWPKIARLLGRTAADGNRVSCYWHDTGQDRPWSCCDKCEQWRLREKGTVVVDGAYWTCADGGRKCTEPCDSVLPETVEEAPARGPQKACPACDAKVHARKAKCPCGHVFASKKRAASPPRPPLAPLPTSTTGRRRSAGSPASYAADDAAVVGTPMALDNDDALQQQPPPDVVEQTAPPPRGSEHENAPMTDAVPSEDDALAYLAEQVDVDSVPHEAPSLPTAGAAAAPTIKLGAARRLRIGPFAPLPRGSEHENAPMTDAVPSEEDALAYLAEQVDVDSVPHEAPSLPTAGAAAAPTIKLGAARRLRIGPFGRPSCNGPPSERLDLVQDGAARVEARDQH